MVGGNVGVAVEVAVGVSVGGRGVGVGNGVDGAQADSKSVMAIIESCFMRLFVHSQTM